MSKSYYKLEIETTLWRKFKSKCAQDGKTMLQVLQELIEKYANK